MPIYCHEALSLDQQQGVIGGWYQHYQQMSPGTFCGQIVQLQLGGVELFEERMNTRIEQHFRAPEGSLVFSFDALDGALYLLNGECQNTWVTPEHYKEVSVVFSRQSLERLGCSQLDTLDGLFLTPLRSAKCQTFVGWLSHVLAQSREGEEQLATAELERLLIDECLSVVEGSGKLLGEAAERRLAVDRRIVQRVLELVTAFPDEPFNAIQLAKAAGVSVRQLQKSFCAFVGLAPTQWLRLRRLNAAYRDLLQASPAETTVAEVAMRWSFWHLGRFSAVYRQLFNELPSATLLRGA